MCVSRGYRAPWQRKTYFTFLTLYILVIPTCIMTYSYAKIIRVVFTRAGEKKMQPKLRFRARNIHTQTSDRHSVAACGAGQLHRKQALLPSAHVKIPKKLLNSSKRKVVKMTLLVIVAFIVCWSPYFIIGLIRIYSEYRIRLDHIFAMSELMAMFHSVLNPLIYGAFSTRSALKSLRTSCLRRKKPERIV